MMDIRVQNDKETNKEFLLEDLKRGLYVRGLYFIEGVKYAK